MPLASGTPADGAVSFSLSVAAGAMTALAVLLESKGKKNVMYRGR